MIFEAAPSTTIKSATDVELVAMFRRGSEEAFSEIIVRYKGKLTATAIRFLKNHGDAEEIVQDAFIRAHKNIDRFRGDCSLSTWLQTITMNLARNRYWYFFRRNRHCTSSLDAGMGDDGITLLEILQTEEPSPSVEISKKELEAAVKSCIAKLKPSHHRIITLRSFLHRSYEEIASDMGINMGTAKSRLARARKNLQELLEENYPEFFPAGNNLISN